MTYPYVSLLSCVFLFCLTRRPKVYLGSSQPYTDTRVTRFIQLFFSRSKELTVVPQLHGGYCRVDRKTPGEYVFRRISSYFVNVFIDHDALT